MRRLLVPRLPTRGHPVQLDENEGKHALHVLRLRDGTVVEVLDGKGSAALATLRVRGDAAFVEVTAPDTASAPFDAGVRSASPEASLPIRVELAIIKGDAMEWAVEKLTELGIAMLRPVVADRTVVKLDRKGPRAFIERWQKIADQALKQCGRLQRLDILEPKTVEELAMEEDRASSRFWCDESASADAPFLLDALAGRRPGGRVLTRVLIGPEGGWSDNERKILSAIYTPVSLGPLVLRAETAAIAAACLSAGAFRSRRLTTLGG